MAPFLCPLRYASDSGVARICQRGAKAMKQSDRVGGGGGGGGCRVSVPLHGREMKIRVSKLYFWSPPFSIFNSPINGGGGSLVPPELRQ